MGRTRVDSAPRAEKRNRVSTQTPHDPSTGQPPKATVGELVARISDQFSRILRGEIQLIQLQLAEKAKNVGVGAALFAVAGLLGFFALAVLIAAAVLGLAVVLPAWLSAIIVAVALLVVAAVLALIGKGRVQAGEAPSAEAAKENLKADINAVKEGLRS